MLRNLCCSWSSSILQTMTCCRSTSACAMADASCPTASNTFSWVEPNFARCFQLMECDDLRLLQEWVLMWRGSGATFEIVPVVSSKDTREVVAPLLDKM